MRSWPVATDLVKVEKQAAKEHVGAVQRRLDLLGLGGDVAVAEHVHLHPRQPPRHLPRCLRAYSDSALHVRPACLSAWVPSDACRQAPVLDLLATKQRQEMTMYVCAIAVMYIRLPPASLPAVLMRARLLIERDVEGLKAGDEHDAAGAPPAHQHALRQAGLADPALLLCKEQVLSLLHSACSSPQPHPRHSAHAPHHVWCPSRINPPLAYTWAVWLALSREGREGRGRKRPSSLFLSLIPLSGTFALVGGALRGPAARHAGARLMSCASRSRSAPARWRKRKIPTPNPYP